MEQGSPKPHIQGERDLDSAKFGLTELALEHYLWVVASHGCAVLARLKAISRVSLLLAT